MEEQKFFKGCLWGTLISFPLWLIAILSAWKWFKS